MARNRITAVPATRLSVGSLRMRQNIILIAVIVAALCGPLALIFGGRGDATAVPAGYSVPEKTIAFAERAATDFLNGTPTELPVASGVDATFGAGTSPDANVPLAYDHLTLYGTTAMAVAGVPMDAIRFDVDIAEVPHWLWISVTYDASGRPVLAAQPSFMAKVVAQSNSVTSPKPLSSTDDIPPLVKDRIGRWAEAYVNGDSAALQVLVNDEAAPTGGVYAGLQGFFCDGTCAFVKWAAPSTRLDGFAIVRVELVLTGIGANGRTVSNELDLLVRGWMTDAPRVQAWGPAGTGSLLDPYSNSSANQ